MDDRQQIKLSSYKGWGSSEKIDAKINIYQVEQKVVVDPLADIKLDDSLKAALRYSTNVTRRSVWRESFGALMLSMLFVWVALVGILMFTMSMDLDLDRSFFRFLNNFATMLVVIMWLVLYERFIILPRSKGRYEQAAREMEPGFRARGWELEFVAKNFDSPFSAVAFFQLTPVSPSIINDGVIVNSTVTFKAEDDEVWVCASNFNASGSKGWLRPTAPSLLDGVPESMKSSVDIFLWGSLTEACVKARTKYFQNQQCQILGVAILSIVVLTVPAVILAVYVDANEDLFGVWFYMGMLLAMLIGFLYFYYAMLSITKAMVAKHSFHPQMLAIVKEFGPKFADTGFHMEYIMEDQEIPAEYVRKGACKSGQGFLRFVSVTKKDYVKISGDAVNNGWIV